MGQRDNKQYAQRKSVRSSNAVAMSFDMVSPSNVTDFSVVFEIVQSVESDFSNGPLHRTNPFLTGPPTIALTQGASITRDIWLGPTAKTLRWRPNRATACPPTRTC